MNKIMPSVHSITDKRWSTSGIHSSCDRLG